MRNYLITIKIALTGLLINKGRAFLTMLGIIIGVASVVSIMSIGAGAQSLITNSIKELGTNVIGVLPGASDEEGPPASAYGIIITTLTYDDAKEIEQLPHVIGVTPYSSGSGEITYEARSIEGTFRGTTTSYQEVENHFIEYGRFFSEDENNSLARVAVLGANIKNELFPFGNPVGERIRIMNQNFKIIGVLEPKGSSIVRNPDNQVLVPINTAQKVLLGVQHIGFMRLKVDFEQNVDETKERVEELLRYRHEIKNPENDDFSVRALSSALDTFTTITDALTFFLAAIAAVSLLVGGIGITNIMFMTVKERTREIGLRKAIGANPSQIKSQFILEAIVLTTVGGILGTISGILFSLLVKLVIQYLGYSWDFVITTSSVVIAFIISMIIGVTFGFYPAKKASELNPIDALRYE